MFLISALLLAAAGHAAMASEVTGKGSQAFQYNEYLRSLGSSSYASLLGSCDLSPDGLLSQGLAIQHVLCDAPAVTESGVCSEACELLVDFQSAACVNEVAEVEALIADDFQKTSEPTEELLLLITKVNAYLSNEYVATDALLEDTERVSAILKQMADSSQAAGLTKACGDAPSPSTSSQSPSASSASASVSSSPPRSFSTAYAANHAAGRGLAPSAVAFGLAGLALMYSIQ